MQKKFKKGVDNSVGVWYDDEVVGNGRHSVALV